MPGFVWRYADESGSAIGTQVSTNPRIIINMSVWEDAPSLEQFVWNTVHERFYRKRAQWFEPYGKPNVVMWSVEPGHRPDVNEGLMRLAMLQARRPQREGFRLGEPAQREPVARQALRLTRPSGKQLEQCQWQRAAITLEWRTYPRMRLRHRFGRH